MPQDLYTLRHASEELNSLTNQAKIQKVNMPNDYEVVFTVYNGKTQKLVISTQANFARVTFTNAEKKNPLVAKNFCMLLRKHCIGARIKNVCIDNNDRIIRLDLENENELKELVSFNIFVEIMGKFSNAFLVSNGIILGCMRVAPQNLDSSRITLSGAKYIFPPKTEKTNPYNKADSLTTFSKFTGGDLGKFILNNFNEFSPVTAEEIAYRINIIGEYNKDIAVKVLTEFLNEPTAPVTITYNGKTDYFAFNYNHLLGERKYYKGLNEAIDSVSTILEFKRDFETLKNGILSKVLAYEKKQLKRLNEVEEKLRECANVEKTKLYAELITANIYALKKGMEKAELINYYSESGETVIISLDKNLSPNENAQKYYKKYAKLKKTASVLQPRKEEILSEINYVENLKFEINNADTIETLNEINEELINSNVIKVQEEKNKKKQVKTHKYRVYKVEKFTVKVGKNNIQNDELTFSANRNDIWLHTKNYHSCHVIIETENNAVTDSVIKTVAEITAYFSSGAGGDKIPVDYTLKKFVKKPPKSKPGSVIYTDFKTVLVTPNEHKELLQYWHFYKLILQYIY